ncbi:hypothetical protein DL768_003769 [Monosporascus sp. mg162]|nr:hypothetical protein DL768_003769 [Monosporascus sp. mg162]
MAALTAAQIELANSLTQDELPTKLRCAICSKLAINAFRLPCCETAICENCQSTLPSSCPVCEHSPVSGADCTVYKSLRTTIRVFLKTEEKKRESARPKPASESTPQTPVQATPTPTQSEAPTVPPQDSAVKGDAEPGPGSARHDEAPAAAESSDQAAVVQDQNSDAQLPREASAEDRARSEQPVEGDDAKALVPSGQEGEDAVTTEEAPENGQDDAANEEPAQSGMEPGSDAMNGNFMNFGGGDMNQMQMMMAMQNGMNPAAFGAFPMMGMDMSMNPIMMQNMFMNGGFGAQGMNSMSMNMGMNGFNGGGNDWNGQQSWNVGQDNFNPNAPGMGNGDFGNFNAGFRNFGHHNQFIDYRRGNYGYRGRGRGRNFYGGFGRGGYHQQGFNNMNGNWAQQINEFSGGNDGQPVSNDAEAANDKGTESRAGKEVDEFGRTIRPDPGQDAQAGGDGQGDGHDGAEGPGNLVSQENSASADVQQSGQAHNDLANGNGDVSSAGQRHFSQGPAGSIGRQSPVVEVPLNAPTGPKAMRQGLPNTSYHRLKARGLIVDEKSPSSGANAQVVASPLEDQQKSRSSSLHSRRDPDRHHREQGRDRDLDEKSRGRHRDRDRDRSKSYSRSRTRSPSRSRSRDRRESRRHRRHRSESASDGGYDDEHRSRRHKSRRKATRDDDYSSRSKEDKHAGASRSPSPGEREHKRSSHRSHRDRDEKRRDRDRDRERESDHDRHRKSSHRSHRDRDYDRERDRERDKERDHERRKERREREKGRRGRGSKSSMTPLTPVEPSDKTFNPPTGPRGSFSIKGASAKPSSSELEIKGTSTKPSNSSKNESEPSRRASQSSTSGQKSAPTGPAKDPHTLEREARDRERLLKEAQRIAGLAGLAGKKRARDGGDDRGSSRRKNRRSEAVNTDEEETRMRRLEAEREGRRWE